MSTPEEKRRAIYNSIRILNEMAKPLKAKVDSGTASSEELSRLQKIKETISKGEKCLK